MDEFYSDAKKILFGILESHGAEGYEDVINQAVHLNKSLIKLPNQSDKLDFVLKYNIWDVYNSIVSGLPLELSEGAYNHSVDRSEDKWDSWEEWCQKVVWWGNKKGAYLYDCNVSDKTPEIEKEPFGNDARYQ